MAGKPRSASTAESGRGRGRAFPTPGADTLRLTPRGASPSSTSDDLVEWPLLDGAASCSSSSPSPGAHRSKNATSLYDKVRSPALIGMFKLAKIIFTSPSHLRRRHARRNSENDRAPLPSVSMVLKANLTEPKFRYISSRNEFSSFALGGCHSSMVMLPEMSVSSARQAPPRFPLKPTLSHMHTNSSQLATLESSSSKARQARKGLP
mmetsp:Transcript_18500/g.53530  ORF Transcript_18500/g.53530 Transcript_18500/m.53530 type:complete len:207 (+) Transcript_18500:759-1379(+)